MQIFASKTSKQVLKPRFVGGFTLLEVLVVISIMAVLTGMVVLGFGGADRAQQQLSLAEGLQQRFELARQRALQRNSTWGVVVEPESYRFAEYDVINAVWVEQAQRPFGAKEVPVPLRMRLEVEGETLAVGAQAQADDDVVPDILFFSSGEATPFTLEITNTANDAQWLLECDGFSVVTLQREGEEV